jgi:ectoine hydroxylase-related dioxygenase (phytanoyl-CoA dioxygenase family)
MPPGREADAEEFAGGPLPDPDADPDRFPILSFDLEAGDAVIFHSLMLHSSRSQILERPRRTFSIRFVGDDIRWVRRRCAYHEWARDLPLATTARLDHERFPLLRGA